MIRKHSTEDSSTCMVDRANRTLFIAGEITQKLASKFRRLFRQLELIDTSTPIWVEINSPGGDIEAGFLIMDTIMLSQCDVVTRATGIAMSMGAMILIAGDQREALPLASIMVHQGRFSMHGRADEIDAEMKECMRVEELCWAILDKQTGKQAGYWKNLCGCKNKYFDAAAALSEDLIHRICQ